MGPGPTAVGHVKPGCAPRASGSGQACNRGSTISCPSPTGPPRAPRARRSAQQRLRPCWLGSPAKGRPPFRPLSPTAAQPAHLEGRWVVNYMYNLLSKYGCYNTYKSRHIFILSCFSNTELKDIVCELSRCTLSCISVLTCIVGRKILLNKGSARPGSRVYSPKIYSKKFVQQDILCLRGSFKVSGMMLL